MAKGMRSCRNKLGSKNLGANLDLLINVVVAAMNDPAPEGFSIAIARLELVNLPGAKIPCRAKAAERTAAFAFRAWRFRRRLESAG
jgi:hypothetical protein